MIYVCNLDEMPGHVQAVRPSHLLSLVTPFEQPPTPEGIHFDRHLRLEINDVEGPMDGCVVPATCHVERMIEFLRSWPHDLAPLLIHCVAGVSRSMAAALIALVIKAGGQEREAARALRAAAPHAAPNRLLIALADRLLGCGGRLIEARDQMGPQTFVGFGPLVRVPLLRQCSLGAA